MAGEFTYSITNNACPFCGTKHDAATSIEDHSLKPEPGDLSMCINCGEWAAFTDDLKLRKPTHEEYEHIVGDDLCRRAREAWKAGVLMK